MSPLNPVCRTKRCPTSSRDRPLLVNATVEGSGDKTVFEAAASGRPVLATSHTFDALLQGLPISRSFTRDDVHVLADKIVSLATASSSLLEQVGQELRSRVGGPSLKRPLGRSSGCYRRLGKVSEMTPAARVTPDMDPGASPTELDKRESGNKSIASLYIDLLKLAVSDGLHPAGSVLVRAASARPVGTRLTTWLRYYVQRLLARV